MARGKRLTRLPPSQPRPHLLPLRALWHRSLRQRAFRRARGDAPRLPSLPALRVPRHLLQTTTSRIISMLTMGLRNTHASSVDVPLPQPASSPGTPRRASQLPLTNELTPFVMATQYPHRNVPSLLQLYPPFLSILACIFLIPQKIHPMSVVSRTLSCSIINTSPSPPPFFIIAL